MVPSPFQWRKFNFFDLKPDVDRGIIQSSLPDEAQITTTTYGNGLVIIGESTGSVYVFRKDWSSVCFKAHDGPVLLSKFCKANSLLVTVGEDSAEGCCFKVWNLSKCARESLPPNCLRSLKIVLQTPTALDISENGQLLAIGYATGSISLYKGDLGRDRSKSCKSLSGGLTAVTGLAFRTSGKVTLLYVCTKQDVLVYNIQASRDRETRIVLQQDSKEKPSPIRCCTLQATGQRSFLVGRDSAIYCFDGEDMGPCHALDGMKSALECFRTYIVIVMRPSKKSISSGQKDSTLTVIDIKNKIIVHTSPIDNVAGIIVEFGSCYILTQQKQMLVLDEKDLEAKLSLLFKKNLYDIAVRVAKNSEYDSGSLSQILRTYADHLYSKNDFGGAVDQYIKTIGHLEPSYVIMKYLDSRHIDCLTTYLEALHRSGHATADHTTLLLNCFTRLDRVDEAKHFLQNDNEPELKYDVDIAIQVCRSASVEHALELARRHQRHRLCISILVEDKREYREALEYIGRLSVEEAEASLTRFGSVLMKHCPKEMTELLKKTCAEYCDGRATATASSRLPVELDSLFDLEEGSTRRGEPENYLHLFVDAPDHLTEFLEFIIKQLPHCNSRLVFNALFENYLEQWSRAVEEEGSGSRQAEVVSVKILDVLQKHYKSIDQSQVLILCRLHNYLPGILWVYEGDQLYHLIVRHYLKHGEYNKLLDTCARLGQKSPSLWLQALTGLRDDPNAPADMMTEILGIIAQKRLQSPLQVLKSLVAEGTSSDGPSLGAVRNYFTQIFRKEDEHYQQEGESVEKYRQDGEKWKEHIKNLQELPIEFKGSNCNTCSQPLTVPSIYYFCQHSFHQDCVRAYTETDSECPLCHAKNSGIVDALRAQQESRKQHDEFHGQLNRSSEPFSLLAQYFGYGLFNRIVIFDENDLKKSPAKQVVNASPAARTTPQVPSQSLAFGSGAEAKMRVTESKSKVIPTPTSEARMRLQEQQRGHKVANAYSSSLEANIDWSATRSRAGTASQRVASVQPTANPPETKQPNYPKSSNPFEDGPVEEEKAKASNPFGEDDDEKEVAKPTEYNPFDQEDEDVSNNNVDNYDKSLNPFDD